MILKKYSNFAQRLITAFAGSAVMIFFIVYSEWGYFGIFFILCVLALLEFYDLSELRGATPQKVFGTTCGVIVFCVVFFVERGNVPSYYYFLIFPLLSCTYLIELYKRPERKPFTNIAYTLLGIFYIAVPVSLIHTMVYEEGIYNFQIIVGCLFILWANDSGAYFAGTLFGKRKLFKSISPKKSWEGVLGGVVLAMIFAFGMASIFERLELWQWFIVATIMIVGGIYGDLVESLLKRSLNIKNSSESLPGHGGFLDRFDGLFLAVPFIIAFLIFLQSFQNTSILTE